MCSDPFFQVYKIAFEICGVRFSVLNSECYTHVLVIVALTLVLPTISSFTSRGVSRLARSTEIALATAANREIPAVNFILEEGCETSVELIIAKDLTSCVLLIIKLFIAQESGWRLFIASGLVVPVPFSRDGKLLASN